MEKESPFQRSSFHRSFIHSFPFWMTPEAVVFMVSSGAAPRKRHWRCDVTQQSAIDSLVCLGPSSDSGRDTTSLIYLENSELQIWSFFQNFHSIWAVSLLVVYTSLWMILLKLFINKEQRQASFRNGDLKHKLTTGFQHNMEVSWRSFKFWMLNEITHFLTQHAALCYTNSNVIDGNVFFSRY